MVSTAKNSTVPKSDKTSIKTSDRPAIIAGLARVISIKTFLEGLCNFVNSKYDLEVSLKDVRANK